MTINLETLEIINNPSENRFETWINGLGCKLDYIEDKDTFAITHVGVHPDLRNQGIAGKLVQFAMDYAKSKSLRVIPICSYAVAWIQRHEEYKELTVKK
ncbi:MAG TPA: GNAT family N-acetyltransferase [Anaerolineae bacterium]|nr:GNAT family N-acetyltransferase [Anaerolineae bacterium]HCK64837.1 GNAT family N-acetyltransferase [Anaerolineae bacterium]